MTYGAERVPSPRDQVKSWEEPGTVSGEASSMNSVMIAGSARGTGLGLARFLLALFRKRNVLD